MSESEAHVMDVDSTYAGSKEYYDYYNYFLSCSCGWVKTVGQADSVDSAFGRHKNEVILKKLGLEFRRVDGRVWND